jgi:hypothetical protein
MPCTQRVRRARTPAYRDEVLPRGVPRVAVEAGVTDFWRKYVGLEGKVIGIDRFGESAPVQAISFKHFGFTADAWSADSRAGPCSTLSRNQAHDSEMTIQAVAINGYRPHRPQRCCAPLLQNFKPHDRNRRHQRPGSRPTTSPTRQYDTVHGRFQGEVGRGRRQPRRQRRGASA